MTDELESFDFDCHNEYDVVEDEVDKLNSVTFGDEIEWNLQNFNNENDDSNFERFPFDEYETNENCRPKISKNENDADDLLGLKGSFFNFGSFKSVVKDDLVQKMNNSIDKDFENAMNKLELLEVKENKNDFDSISDDMHNIIYATNIESPLTQLTKYSEILYLQFMESKKLNSSSQYLNGIVAKHLNLLSKKLIELSLPMDVLAQLKYFRLLTTFVSVDNRVNEIRAKCASDPRVYNAEMSTLMQHFVSQTPEQQAELSEIHPFYNGILECLRNQITLPSQRIVPACNQQQFPNVSYGPVHKWHTTDDCSNNEGGWVTPSEREWLMKQHTRNLVSDNPYMQDYYYTTMKFREMASAREAQLAATGHTTIPDPLCLLPSPITADHIAAGIDPVKDGMPPMYSPSQFENSLGILTTSNVNTPRQTIQLPPRHRVVVAAAPVTDASQDMYRPIRCQRELLSVIEKLHCTVLRVDEVDKSIAKMLVEQHHSRSVLLQHRSYLLNLLMDAVNSNTRFVQLFSVAKGARILASILAIVNSVQFLQLMRTLFFNCLSIWESDFFAEFETEYRSIIVSRVRKLQKDELSLLITTFFCNLTSKSFSDKIKLQPLSGFCRCEFGLHIVLTVLEAFFKISPDDKANVHHLVAVAVRSSDSKSVIHKVLKDFDALFATISGPK